MMPPPEYYLVKSYVTHLHKLFAILWNSQFCWAILWNSQFCWANNSFDSGEVDDETVCAIKETRRQARNQRAQELYQQSKSAASYQRKQDNPDSASIEDETAHALKEARRQKRNQSARSLHSSHVLTLV